MTRLGHIAVVKAVKFEECDILVTIQAQHPYEIGCFLISSEEFHFPVSRDDKERGGVSSDKIKWCKFVNGRGQLSDSIFLSLGKVGYDLSAIRHNGGH